MASRPITWEWCLWLKQLAEWQSDYPAALVFLDHFHRVRIIRNLNWLMTSLVIKSGSKANHDVRSAIVIFNSSEKSSSQQNIKGIFISRNRDGQDSRYYFVRQQLQRVALRSARAWTARLDSICFFVV